MNKLVSPFTTTPGIAGPAYINIHCADEIIENFGSNYSTQYVYKILGLRGSGKSVEYKRVMDYFDSRDDWKVYGLAAGGDPVHTILSALSREKEVTSLHNTVENVVSGSIAGGAIISEVNATASKKSITASNPNYFSAEDDIQKMCREICSKGFSILIGIDDIAYSDSMSKFLSIVGKLVLDSNIKIRLIATGLEKNIEQFLDVAHLSFFARPKPYIIKALNLNEVAIMYRNLLGIDTTDARMLAEISRGYAWGYQLLGDEYFCKSKNDTIEDVFKNFDMRMASTYDLIWNSLTSSEREFIKVAVNSETGSRSEIEPLVSGYSQHRQSLKKKHVIDASENGYIKINLPRFKEYIETEW